jgi:hypothetical protein
MSTNTVLLHLVAPVPTVGLLSNVPSDTPGCCSGIYMPDNTDSELRRMLDSVIARNELQPSPQPIPLRVKAGIDTNRVSAWVKAATGRVHYEGAAVQRSVLVCSLAVSEQVSRRLPAHCSKQQASAWMDS